MKKIILAVFNQFDLNALPSAVRSLAALGTTHLWLIHDPSIGITEPPEAESIRKEIAGIETAKAQAISREDYVTAGQYKDQAESAKVRLSQSLANGYKNMDKPALESAYAKAFESVTKAAIPSASVIVIEPLPETAQPQDIFQVLHRMTGSNWPQEMPVNECAVAFPSALSGIGYPDKPKPLPVFEPLPQAVEAQKLVNDFVAVEPQEQKPNVFNLNRTTPEYYSYPWLKLVKFAKDNGIDPEGKKKPELLSEIDAKLMAPPTVPA